MLFRQLEYFVALARERHFGRAAAAEFVSQPALSAAISKLEHELDVSLIRRGHTFQGLTPEGERLVVWARRILAEHDAFKQQVHAVRGGLTGRLRLGVIPTASTTSIWPVNAFCAAHPLVTVDIQSRLSSEEAHRRLQAFEIDAAITYIDREVPSDLLVVPLYEERFVLAVPTDMVPEGAAVSWADIASLPLALVDSKMQSRQLVDAAFAAAGVEAAPQLETDSVASLLAAVGTGRWASIIPETWTTASGLPPRLRIIRLENPAVTGNIGVVISAATPGSPLAVAFAQTAAELGFESR
ncbi:MAG TPA: LysR family transcriptional regulator [Galbitalea sp.]|jgi:DNA-binding transcriptional LysR family regulator